MSTENGDNVAGRRNDTGNGEIFSGDKEPRMNETQADPARKQARRTPVHFDGARGQIRWPETF